MPDQPRQQPPPVQRLRVRYTKRGRLRFTSHRDFGRAFERALVRAGIPMAYSSGFSPHPRISYAGAAPTGAASEAEYLEIGLAEQVDPAEVQRQLDGALPDGLDVVEVVTSSGGALADRLEASHWQIRLPGVDPESGQRAVREFLDTPEVRVERMTKKGVREFDVRAAVVSLEVGVGSDEDRSCAILEVVLRHGTPAVRPDDVLAGLRSAGLRVPVAVLQQRLAQGPLGEAGTVGDPLAPDRDVAG
ncbi:MAG: TIGR03936 family radical SAM-associated protein [Marmoricola sp.]